MSHGVWPVQPGPPLLCAALHNEIVHDKAVTDVGCYGINCFESLTLIGANTQLIAFIYRKIHCGKPALQTQVVIERNNVAREMLAALLLE